jgi:isoamylase
MNAAVPAIDPSPLTLQSGEPSPLGATWTGSGVNFAVHCSGAEFVELCLFDSSDKEFARLTMPSISNGVAFGFLPAPVGAPGLLYGYRVHGPYDPDQGQRFNAHKLLIDPYARAHSGTFEWNDALFAFVPDETANRLDTRDSAPYIFKGRVVDQDFDWSGDHPPATPWRDSVVYELHVKGFTQLHPEVPTALRGKYGSASRPLSCSPCSRSLASAPCSSAG